MRIAISLLANRNRSKISPLGGTVNSSHYIEIAGSISITGKYLGKYPNVRNICDFCKYIFQITLKSLQWSCCLVFYHFLLMFDNIRIIIVHLSAKCINSTVIYIHFASI